MSTPVNPPPVSQPQPGTQPSPQRPDRSRRLSTETKASYKTTELIVYIAAVIGVLIASAVVDADEDGQWFTAAQAWTLVTWLTIGYMISRGLAKSGSREPYDDSGDDDGGSGTTFGRR
jgi:hypothetical protein